MKKLQIGSFTVEIEDDALKPLTVKIFNQQETLISSTGEASDGMLITVSVEGVDSKEIDRILHQALQHRSTANHKLHKSHMAIFN